MKKIKIFSYMLLVFAALLAACEDTDTAFNPQNPNLSEDAVLGVPNSAGKLLLGCERQISLAMNEIVVITEIASDNYANTQTFFNQFLDNLNIDATDDDIDDAQFTFHRLRELALKGLNDIGPADPNFDDDEAAEFNFMAGYAHLLSAMYYKSLPAEPGGAPQSSETHYNVALQYFDEALKLTSNPTTVASAQLASARAHYFLGDVAAASTAANAAIAADPSFVRFAQFDAINGPTNAMQDALYDRGTFDDLQPLPKLDFLDPKYNGADATQEVNVPILKIEEAHLILAEAALASNNLSAAQGIMKDIIGLVSTRPTLTFDDAREGRDHDNPGSRPDNPNVMVAASASDPMRAGLVISRQSGRVTIPVVSATSVTADMVDVLANADDALEMLYLMRQEIFIAEGMRMVDMGVKFVTSQVESILNDNVGSDDLTPNIPDFINAIKTELDDFTYDAGAGTCVIKHNVNRILVDNKASAAVLPFH